MRMETKRDKLKRISRESELLENFLLENPKMPKVVCPYC
jgi:hypothetical protein